MFRNIIVHKNLVFANYLEYEALHFNIGANKNFCNLLQIQYLASYSEVEN